MDNDFLRPPLIILGRGLGDIDHVIEAAGLLPIGVGVINLALKAELWKALFLVLRVEINTSVCARVGHHIHFEVKVCEWHRVANVEQVSGLAPGHECAVLNLPGIGVVGGRFPAIEGLPVAQQGESGFDVSSQNCAGGGRHRSG